MLSIYRRAENGGIRNRTLGEALMQFQKTSSSRRLHGISIPS